MTKSIIIFSIIAVIFLGFTWTLTGCKPCKIGDFNYSIPPTIPGSIQSVVLKIENNPSFISSSGFGPIYYNPGTTIYLNRFAKNEFFSIQRWDPAIGSNIVIYWISDFIPFNKNNPNPIFRDLKNGEEIQVYNCVFIQSSHLSCLFKSKPKSKTKLSVIVKVQNGSVVDTQTSKTDDNENSLKTYGYYLSNHKAIVRTKGEYFFEIVANSDSLSGERDYNDNKYIVRGQNL